MMREENKSNLHSQRHTFFLRLIGFIFLSLLVHAFFVSALFRKQFCKHVTNSKAPNKNNMPAQLRAPLSEFGWVLFGEPAKISGRKGTSDVTEIPTTMDGEIGHASRSIATEGKPKPAQAHAEKLPSQLIPNATKQPAAAKSTPEHIAQVATLQKSFESFQATGSEQTDVQEAQHQAIPAVTLPKSTERMIGGAGGIRVRGARSIDGKPKRTIIALTKGFIEKHEGPAGTDLIDRDGDPNKRPSFEELKYLSYESQISWSLQATWKQNFERLAKTEGDAFIEFELDEHGKVLRHSLLKSTGSKELDTYIIKSLEYASPFPPLPKHFGVKIYKTGRHINVSANNRVF